jgi:Flp pilus assembly protein TadD
VQGDAILARVRATAFGIALLLMGAVFAAGFYGSLQARHRLPGLSQDPLLEAVRARERGDRPGSLRENRDAVALSASRYSNLLDLTQSLTMAGDGQSADRAFAAAQSLRPHHTSLSRGEGFVLFGQGHLLESEAAFRRALRWESRDAKAWVGLGDVLLQQDRYAEAEHALGRALALRPNNHGALNSLGIVYALAGRHDEAIYAFETVMRREPSPGIAANIERARADKAATEARR